ncbi:imidazoleglycerol-phosphate dehydratase HisB [Kamptonema cortianum]|nr:imidazoleglycerol-phosphate dehydratase HisB [Geitlerinema splendidum]MDK3157642.1 imidazoleglycerol-phosphate dehydratase HisB [Kamptonema cortianum]
MSKGSAGVRFAEVFRETKETKVNVVIDFDGGTKQDINTGIGFFDHMLAQLAFHGQINLGITCEGDLEIDDHHTIEDVGITLGKAIHQALKDSNVKRYASIHVPMDDALVLAAIDIGGRGVLGWEVPFSRESIGGMAMECVHEFFKSLAHHSGINIHLHKVSGYNDHHVCEATFKAFGIALNQAARMSDRKGPSSTKGRVE